MSDHIVNYNADLSSARQRMPPPPGLNFTHTIGGLHVGRYTPRPLNGEFGSVLSVGADPGTVEDGIRHKHLPIPYIRTDEDAVRKAADWVEDQTLGDRTVLVRSEGGRQRPALVIAYVIVRMGGSFVDAINCVRRRDITLLSDFRYLDMLKAYEIELRAPRDQAPQ